jgi:hypothetical protein
MAIVYEETLVIKFSRLVRQNQTIPAVVTTEILSALEQVAQELVGDSVVVEVESTK